jgi:hypothetical protein
MQVDPHRARVRTVGFGPTRPGSAVKPEPGGREVATAVRQEETLKHQANFPDKPI